MDRNLSWKFLYVKSAQLNPIKRLTLFVVDAIGRFMTDETHKLKIAASKRAILDQSIYRDKRTARFANGERVKEFQAFEKQAKKRLLILKSSVSRNGLMRLPSNHFEALDGDRKGQFSIRINQQWRVCFEWPDDVSEPFNIEIVDYH